MEKNEILEAFDYFFKGFSFHLSGQLDLAIIYYKKSLEIFPTLQAYLFLSMIYAERKDYNQAIELCRKAITLDTEFGETYTDMGIYLKEMGNIDEALYYFEIALQKGDYPSKYLAYYNLGKIYKLKGLYRKAKIQFEKSLQLLPDFELARIELLDIEEKIN